MSRICLLTYGSRGDIQPLVALAAGLQKAGFVVLVTTHTNHTGFFEKFGIQSVAVHPDQEEFLRLESIKKAVSDGDTLAFVKALGAKNKVEFPLIFEKLKAAMMDFSPDLLMCHLIEYAQGLALAEDLGIPAMGVAFTPIFPTRAVASMLGEPAWLPGRFHAALRLAMLYMMYREIREAKFHVMKEQLGLTEVPNQWCSFRAMVLDFAQPDVPMCFGCSPAIEPPQGDWSPEAKRSALTGYWIIDGDEQQRRFQHGDDLFGGLSAKALREFIVAAEPPVYMGWGSMVVVSPEYMVQLAVGSLKQAGLRGIICGGWAKLSSNMLEGNPSLLDYAQNNIIFVDTAPHEWLFPQCSVTVHHGGAGTTAAAFRSGVPTILTPCFLDQFENARLVHRSKAGIGLPQLSKVSAKTLANSMMQCVAPDSEIRRTAAQLGNKLQSEDGVAVGVDHVRRFLAEDVATGRWRAKHVQRKAEKTKLRAKGAGGCLFWLGKVCCGQSLNSYELS